MGIMTCQLIVFKKQNHFTSTVTLTDTLRISKGKAIIRKGRAEENSPMGIF